MLQDFSHGGNIYRLMNGQKAGGGSLLDFSANINPLGLTQSVREAIFNAVEMIIHYPDPDANALKAAISSCYTVPAETITVGNGAVEFLYMLCNHFRPSEAVVFAPAFSEYERAARASGAVIRHIYCDPAASFVLDLKQAASVKPGGMVFLGNPNNPTGTLLSRDALSALLTVCQSKQSIVVVDESFVDFLPNHDQVTCRPLLAQFENLVIIHSLTKFYAIPGLRLGFALTSPALARQLSLVKDPWNVNSLAQAAGVAALTDLSYQQESRRIVSLAKDELYHNLCRIKGFKPFRPSVNFILIDVSETNRKVSEWSHQLNGYGIMVRDCGNYPGLTPEYMRVAVKLPEQNAVLLNRLQEINGR